MRREVKQLIKQKVGLDYYQMHLFTEGKEKKEEGLRRQRDENSKMDLDF